MAINRFAAVLALMLACDAVASGAKQAPPDPDLLEFLGTYETAGGQEIDPLLLNDAAASGAPAEQKAERRSIVRKKAGKDTQRIKRETNDD